MLFLISITEIVYDFSSIKIIKFKSFLPKIITYRQYATTFHLSYRVRCYKITMFFKFGVWRTFFFSFQDEGDPAHRTSHLKLIRLIWYSYQAGANALCPTNQYQLWNHRTNFFIYYSCLSFTDHTQSIFSIRHHLLLAIKMFVWIIFIIIELLSSNEFVFEIKFSLIDCWWDQSRKDGGQIRRHEQWSIAYIFWESKAFNWSVVSIRFNVKTILRVIDYMVPIIWFLLMERMIVW